MHKHFTQNQPRSEERGQPFRLKRLSSKRSAWHSFSNRYGAYTLCSTAPVFAFIVTDFPAVREIAQRPQSAAGILRLALAAGSKLPDFSKSTRRLTEQIPTEYYGDGGKFTLPKSDATRLSIL